MFSERVLSVLIVIFVVVITTGFFVTSEPEESYLRSSDGAVTVTGLARLTQPFTIDAGKSVSSPLIGASYHVKPDGVILDESAVVAFNVPAEQAEHVASLGVYRLHPDLHMWELVSPVVAHTDEIVAVETARLGEFALGQVSAIDAPVFANIYDELRAMAPENAVGYETAVGYGAGENEIIRLLSEGEAGGCGGALRVGDAEQYSQLQRDVTLAEHTVTFVFVTRWFTSSAGGCVDESPLMPLLTM